MRLPLKRLFAFVLLFNAMYAALSQAWGEGFSRWVADGSHLRSPQASVNVLNGCEGTDALMLLAGALLTAPVAWRDRLLLLVVLLDVPLMLYGAAWYQEVSLLDPDRFSPIAYWADFMNAGGRFVLTIAAVVLSVLAASPLDSGSRSRT